jgi:plastocyanin
VVPRQPLTSAGAARPTPVLVGRRAAVAALAAVAAAVLGGGALAAPARAADAKVAIGHYRWSNAVVHVDLGQHVTWYWVGPDTMHSVTGISANDVSEDSDPNNPTPDHKLGATFRLSFTHPGVYTFQCKLHPVVRGEVIVSDAPGSPSDDPDPIPKLNVDLTRPTLSGLHLSAPRFPAAGTMLNLTLDDPSLIDAEIWHVRAGHRGAFAGWRTWRAHIGFNYLPFGGRGGHFKPAPGRYVAFVQATDLFNNTSRIQRVAFTIAGPAKPAKRRR